MAAGVLIRSVEPSPDSMSSAARRAEDWRGCSRRPFS